MSEPAAEPVERVYYSPIKEYKALYEREKLHNVGGELVPTKEAEERYIRFRYGQYVTSDPAIQAFLDNHADVRAGLIIPSREGEKLKEATPAGEAAFYAVPKSVLSASSYSKSALWDYAEYCVALGKLTLPWTKEEYEAEHTKKELIDILP